MYVSVYRVHLCHAELFVDIYKASQPRGQIVRSGSNHECLLGGHKVGMQRTCTLSRLNYPSMHPPPVCSNDITVHVHVHLLWSEVLVGRDGQWGGQRFQWGGMVRGSSGGDGQGFQ